MAASQRTVPSGRLIGVLFGLGLVSIGLATAAAVSPALLPTGRLQALLAGAAVAVAVLALWDVWHSRRKLDVQLTRTAPATVAVDKFFTVTLKLEHGFRAPVTAVVYEQLPLGLVCPQLPLQVQLQPGSTSAIEYRAKATQRGDLHFTALRLHVPSGLGLWRVDQPVALAARVQVYPDFSAIATYSLLALDNHVGQVGIRKKPRRGEGTDFHQLREYRQGDTLRQVDWKATSRKRKIISRDYTDERDQEIVLLLDTGRRMRAKDDELSHFDHSLNAILLVSYIALRQGDSVSLLTFGGQERWIPRQKGPGQVQTILNAVYDLHANQTAADYVSAAQRLSRLQRKRALVMLVSNCRDEDADELSLALQLLRQRHVVLLANLREAALDQRLRDPVQSFEEALTYAGVSHYLASRDAAQQQLRSRGALVLDATPAHLAAQLANAYLEVKSAGIL